MIFPQKNVRFIAINDGVDSAQGDNDFAPLRNIFNEWLVRDTSKKIRAVMKMHSSAGRKMEATMKIIVSGVMQRGSLYISQESLYWIILWNICRILIIWEWMTDELNLIYIFHS